MNNYSAIYPFLWLSPSLYKQKQKKFWFHFCWPPTDNLSPTKMDFIFVGFPGQQKWKQFWRFHDLPKFSVLIHRTVLKYWYDRTASLTMILYISGSFVQTAVSQCQESHSPFYLCFCTCMPFNCTALSWDASLRIMESDVIWGAIVTVFCRDSSTVDNGQETIKKQKTHFCWRLRFYAGRTKHCPFD